MVTYQQLRDFDPGPLRELGACYDGLARSLVRRSDALHLQVSRMSGHWRGEAYDSAVDRFRRIRGELDDTEAPLTAIGVGLAGAADDLQRAQGMLLDALDAAARLPAVVGDDGQSITYTGPELDKERMIGTGRRMATLLEDIDAALAAAQRADRAAAALLGKLVPGHDPADPAKGKVPASAIPPPGTDPGKVNDWWRGLTPAERQYLIHHHPDRVGNLDGVPVVARDQANRVRLAREQQRAADRKARLEDRKADLEADLARAGGVAPGDFEGRAERERIQDKLDTVNAELSVVNRNLQGMKTLEDRLYESPDKPRAYLIGFEPGTLTDRGGDGVADDDGRAILAVGNPDTADHVATYVPGTGADLDSIHKDIDRADRMAVDARRAAPAEDTSVVVWVDYDAPDHPVRDAWSAEYAEDATDDLRRFQDGLRVTHDGPRSHNTVLGHSYGSTVIGHAASDGGGIAVDDLVFVASPGVGVDEATDLHMPPDHVWSTTAEHDAINDVAGWHGGANPSAPGFGGNVFESDPGDPDDRRGTHSDYWDKGNVARENFGYIITGQPEKVTVASVPAPEPPSWWRHQPGSDRWGW